MVFLGLHFGRETREEGPKGHAIQRAAHASSERSTIIVGDTAYGRYDFFPNKFDE